MESVSDADDREQDGNGTWLRHEGWYNDKMCEHFGDCRSKRVSVDDVKYCPMVMYHALLPPAV